MRRPVLLLVLLATGCGASSPSAPVGSVPGPLPSARPRPPAGDAGAAAAAAPPTTSPAEPDEGDAPAGFDERPVVRRGACDTSFLPDGTRLDLSDEEAAAVVELLQAWLGGSPESPVFDGTRGIVFAKSEDDRGDDPPYPTDARATSERACALHATWLRSHVREVYARSASPGFEGVTCDENVCCTAGMEYLPTTGIVLRPRDPDGSRVWVLESFFELAEATLGPETVAANRRSVSRALARLARGTCRGEPPGLR